MMSMMPPRRLRLLAAGVNTSSPPDAAGRVTLVGVATGAEDVGSMKETFDPHVVVVGQTMAHLAAELEGCGIVVVGQDQEAEGGAGPKAEPSGPPPLPHELLETLAVLGWLGAMGGPMLAPFSAS